ncbi:S41 family peptidase [Bacillus sp. FJAT-49705]|uniref:S41 family peptidase n=1 Tax=Cytobacillus citreus TaxID=2833586 RepID=A0ABS5NQP6_9BACI|nr:S41 family peptidase [Cytobacillus citreus]MBS4190147.1 S41 family peptidase [Cytobacillus citreus]
MHNLKKYISFLLVLLLLSNVTAVSAAVPIDEIRDLIKEYYIEDVPASVLAKPTAKEITKHLDPYSVYMTTEEFAQFSNGIEQQLVGVGIVLDEDEKGIKIMSVIKGGPADRGGMKAGDIIVSVNGVSLVGQPVQKAVSLISGKANTSVTLRYISADTNETVTKTLTREVIKLPNVEYQMLGGEIGYIRLNSFSNDATKEITNAIGKLTGAKGWIFDLRDNGGGYVSTAQEVAGLFPNVNKAFQIRDKTKQPEIYAATPQKVKFTSPTHILINEYSASASEMVAVSVKEQKGATLYGQTSFGKGSMQSLFPLSDNSMLKLTTARFYSPKGVPVHETGVKPNIETAVGEELITSHRDQLIAKHATYQKLPALNSVPVTKTFTVEMNMEMDWSKLSPQDVQLIHLGGNEVPVEVNAEDHSKMTIKPKANLQSKGKYMLIIHPKWTSKNANRMQKGIYLEVTVQ